MKITRLTLLLAVVVLTLAGCSTPPPPPDDPSRAQTERIEAVRGTGRQAAVLSLHKRTAFPNACTYGITLTNNLPYDITNIAFRFSAYVDGGVLFTHVTRNFYRINPTNHQYREITFTQVRCEQIEFIEVSDPGRCAMGKLTKFSSNPGDCIRHVDIAPTSLVRLVRK
jgi:hypothetical protein